MTSKSKSWLVLFRLMNYRCPLNGKANLLLLRPLMKSWKSMTHWMRMWLTKMLHTLWKIFGNSWNSRIMVNLVIKGNSNVQEWRKENSKGKMEKNPNLHKVSLVLNATSMDTLRKNVRIIWNRKARCMPRHWVTWIHPTQILRKVVMKKGIILLLWLLPMLSL